MKQTLVMCDRKEEQTNPSVTKRVGWMTCERLDAKDPNLHQNQRRVPIVESGEILHAAKIISHCVIHTFC